MDVAANVCDEIITDEEWLWQMLLNLLTNACKYTDKGEIVVKVRTCTDIILPDSDKSGQSDTGPARGQKEALMFEVIDTGIITSFYFSPSLQIYDVFFNLAVLQGWGWLKKSSAPCLTLSLKCKRAR
jgi:hypothetical protein